MRSNPAIFIGGGSILLRPFLEQSPLVAKADFVENPNANALGYEIEKLRKEFSHYFHYGILKYEEVKINDARKHSNH